MNLSIPASYVASHCNCGLMERFDKETRKPGKGRMALEYEELTERIIGAAIEVHRRLGPGFLESLSQMLLLRNCQHGVMNHLRSKSREDDPCTDCPWPMSSPISSCRRR